MRQNPAERVAAAIRSEMSRQQISGRDLSRALGWKNSTLARRLNGSYPMTVSELAVIADHLGVPLVSLVADDATESAAT